MSGRPPLSFDIVCDTSTVKSSGTRRDDFTTGATEMEYRRDPNKSFRTNHSHIVSASGRPAPVTRRPGSGYLSDIRRFSMLEKELEYRLAKRWQEHGDRKAADQIVTSHLRLAAKIATTTAAMVCRFRRSYPKAMSA